MAASSLSRTEAQPVASLDVPADKYIVPTTTILKANSIHFRLALAPTFCVCALCKIYGFATYVYNASAASQLTANMTTPRYKPGGVWVLVYLLPMS